MSSPHPALPSFSQTFGTTALNILYIAIDIGSGAGLIGTWIAVGLCGLTISQTLLYFSNYPNDARQVKVMVCLDLEGGSILHTLHCVVICRLVYGYLIFDAFNLELLTQNNWCLAVSVIVMVYLVVVIFKGNVRHEVHSWVALIRRLAASFRVKYLGWLFVALNGISIFVHAVLIVQVFRIKQLVDSPDLATAVLSTAGTQVAADVLIAGSLCIVLRSHWSQYSGRGRTNSTIKSLMLCAISRGVTLQLAIEPRSMWYIGCEFAIVGLYINALMVSLNSRNRMRSQVESSVTLAKATSIGEDSTHGREKTAG
ncbi:hypothetical protein FB45DRAFT_906287 [Roridomyces roridus]|uniref:DUF6534 domain-containing protein n=1 Tax=Roridomyces roridus TaxID=1738132 RepID=A0AAD7FPJ1_9AGAR|nr:hypothetical protein FB45DRAFT_906287 [Roridomyces roridus]